jgi:hypothetical protein
MVKEVWQLNELTRLFKDHKGDFTEDQKEEAIEATGLTWRQIYKWVFDRYLQNKDDTLFKSSELNSPQDQ